MMCINSFDLLIRLLGLIVAITALFIASASWITSRRAHLLSVYNDTMKLMDTPEMRDARHYVYSLRSKPGKNVQKNTIPTFDEQHLNELKDKENIKKVELVARSFDYLGLLVREGKVPLNIIAQFYASPVIRCWYLLSPYINKVRSPDERNQPGHMWEWENLVNNIIIPRLNENESIWKGVKDHDELENYVVNIIAERETMNRDKSFSPDKHLWTIGSILDFRKW